MPSQQLPHMLTLSEQEQLQLLSEQIALEAALIDQIADSLRNTTLDVSQVFLEIAQSGRWLLESESAVVCPEAPADAWAKKVLASLPKCPSCEEAEAVEEVAEEAAAEEAEV